MRRLPVVQGPGVERLPGGRWRVPESGTFALGPAGDLRGRWVELRLAPRTAARLPPSSLVVDAGGEEELVAEFPANGQAVARLARLPPRADLLLLRVGRGDFDLDAVDVRPLWRL